MAKKNTLRSKKKTTRKAPARGGANKKTTRKKKGATGDLIISKSRTKAMDSLNVSSDFYGALDEKVREMITMAEHRATENRRATLRPQDL